MRFSHFKSDCRTKTSYDPEHFQALFHAENRHFWFRGRNRIILTLVEQIVADLEPGYHVLEVGCGTGNVLRVLEQACPQGQVIGMDLFSEGLQYARKRGASALVQGNMHTPPFHRSFHLIGLFDVLEHLSDDRRVLQDVHRMLAPGGSLLLTVPAHPSLWSYFDELSHHQRRYGMDELKGKLCEAGYQIDYVTPYMLSLYPLMLLKRRFAVGASEGNSSDSARMGARLEEELKIVPLLNEILYVLLTFERFWVARRKTLPGGTSLLAVARKIS